jgi:hypothetical protein
VLAELDLDHHVVCTALHPNVWYAHGPAQIELWLGDCLRVGLRLIPSVRGWQQALLPLQLSDHACTFLAAFDLAPHLPDFVGRATRTPSSASLPSTLSSGGAYT